MFDHQHYVPILKWRRGEQLALRELDDNVRERLTPLIEIPPVPWDYANDCPAKTLDDHLDGTAASILRNWGRQRIFVDLPWCYDERVADGRLAVEKVFEDIFAADLPAIPVTGLERGDDYQAAIRAIATRSGTGVCIRVEPEDCGDPISLNRALDDLCAQLGLERNNCDLLLDFKSVTPDAAGPVRLAVNSLLQMLPGLAEWRTLIWAGSSFPENLSDITPNTTTLLPRSEWAIWTDIAARGGGPRIPTFGDYPISHPEPVDVDPRVMRMSANLRYTTPDAWLVLKGRNVRQHGHEQFNGLCRILVAHPLYSGPAFSWGDNYIHLCAQDQEGPGNAGTWRKIGVSHHLTLVTRTLSTFFVP